MVTVGTVAASSLAVGGYAHFKERVSRPARKLMSLPTLAMDGSSEPVHRLRLRRKTESELMTLEEQVFCTLDNFKGQELNVALRGEVLLCGSTSEDRQPILALGGADVRKKGNTLVVTGKPASCIMLQFTDESKAAEWSASLREAAKLPPPEARIDQLVNHVVGQEKCVADLHGDIRRRQEEHDKLAHEMRSRNSKGPDSDSKELLAVVKELRRRVQRHQKEAIHHKGRTFELEAEKEEHASEAQRLKEELEKAKKREDELEKIRLAISSERDLTTDSMQTQQLRQSVSSDRDVVADSSPTQKVVPRSEHIRQDETTLERKLSERSMPCDPPDASFLQSEVRTSNLQDDERQALLERVATAEQKSTALLRDLQMITSQLSESDRQVSLQAAREAELEAKFQAQVSQQSAREAELEAKLKLQASEQALREAELESKFKAQAQAAADQAAAVAKERDSVRVRLQQLEAALAIEEGMSQNHTLEGVGVGGSVNLPLGGSKSQRADSEAAAAALAKAQAEVDFLRRKHHLQKQEVESMYLSQIKDLQDKLRASEACQAEAEFRVSRLDDGSSPHLVKQLMQDNIILRQHLATFKSKTRSEPDHRVPEAFSPGAPPCSSKVLDSYKARYIEAARPGSAASSTSFSSVRTLEHSEVGQPSSPTHSTSSWRRSQQGVQSERERERERERDREVASAQAGQRVSKAPPMVVWRQPVLRSGGLGDGTSQEGQHFFSPTLKSSSSQDDHGSASGARMGYSSAMQQSAGTSPSTRMGSSLKRLAPTISRPTRGIVQTSPLGSARPYASDS